MEGHDRLLTQAEVARLFRVDSKTVRRWRQRGLITMIRTPGGHPRYLESEIRLLLDVWGVTPNDRPGAELPRSPGAGPVPQKLGPGQHPADPALISSTQEDT